MITGGAVLIDALKEAGVRYIFANVGSTEAPIYDALTKTAEMELISGLHEGIVISMADGYHRASRSISVVNVHTIAGTAQMAGQLYNAFMDRSSMLITAGLLENDIAEDELMLSPPSGTHQAGFIAPLTRGSWEVRDASGIRSFTLRAMSASLIPPEGPVYLALPEKVLHQHIDAGQVERGTPLPRAQLAGPDEAEIEEMAKLMIEAKSIAFMAGDDVYRHDARGELIYAADAVGAGCFTGFTAYMNFPSRHHLHMGYHALIPNAFPQGLDLLVVVGARNFGYYPASFFPEAPPYDRCIWIGADPMEMARAKRLEAGAVCHLKRGLAMLREAVEEMTTEKWRRDVRGPRRATAMNFVRKRREAKEKTKSEAGDAITVAKAQALLEKLLPANSVVVHEAPTTPLSDLPYGPGEMELFRTTGGSLGWAPGAAAGIQLAWPERQVVCSVGDGSAMYSASAFWTYARYGLPVLTLIWNNRGYRIVRNAFRKLGGAMAEKGEFPGTQLVQPDIDFALLAKSQGVEAERAETMRDLAAALERALGATTSGKPYLIDVVLPATGGD